MQLLDHIRKLKQQSGDHGDAFAADQRSLSVRLLDVTLRTWHLGFTAFGGAAAQFQLYRRKFVRGERGRPPWVDDDTASSYHSVAASTLVLTAEQFQELLGLCQSTPGPASTKLLACLVWIHAGPLPSIWVSVLWTAPTAFGMLALGLGIQRVDSTLPDIAYAFLSGLNAAIVGVVAISAIELSRKSTKRQLDRVLILFGACAGVCYSSLWYFPALITSGGIVTLAWRYGIDPIVRKCRATWNARRSTGIALAEKVDSERGDSGVRAFDGKYVKTASEAQSAAAMQSKHHGGAFVIRKSTLPLQQTDTKTYQVNLLSGIVLILSFFTIVISLVVVSRTIASPPRPLQFTANMVLAGSIIFGGGPVLIPLMRDYVVLPGWVTPRDFLIGLAIIQIFPGPNFNFAVYLGVLSMLGTPYSTVIGGFLGFMGIFTPGMLVGFAFMGFWRTLRKRPAVVAFLRGVNCTAVGLIFTAVYRIWQIGFLTAAKPEGRPLGDDPWWLVVAVVAYSVSAWLNAPSAAAIVLGGVMGLAWYGVTTS